MGRILSLAAGVVVLAVVGFTSGSATGGDATNPTTPIAAHPAIYPVVLRTRYEAVDQKAGGHFIIWLEREKAHHGLDPRLYPAVRYVDVTHVTPSPGSPIISLIEVMPVNSTTPEVYHLAGIARFKVTGMRIVASTVPHP
ncbi:hypothetical protein [Rhodoplanes sp. SY1]|uniref:hypothetical protein n=1 Tax=Rhodoplanes sp. SY1 TaxID=3166646 RepID=UPI0038B69FE3